MKILQLFLAVFILVSGFAAPSPAGEWLEITRPREGAEFPDFTLPDADGKPVSLSDFRGKAIMLSFWSCFSDTCFTSVRVIEGLLEKYSSQGLVAPTVCSEIPPALEKNSYSGLLERCGTGQVVLIDREMNLKEKLGITVFPTTFLIDRNYVVWRIVTGIRPVMDKEFQRLVQSLVQE